MSSGLTKPKALLSDVTADCRRWPTARGFAYLLALTALGLLGNHLNIELFFGVNFLFGSVATMIAVRTSGTLWGTLVGIVIGSYTYFLWGHPYAIYIFGLEAFVVGCVICITKKDNMILVDVVYWLFIGAPLVWIFYTFQLGLPEMPVAMIALKQSINGISNVVIANLILQTTLVDGLQVLRGKDAESGSWALSAAVNNIIAFFILVPTLGTMTISNSDELGEIQANLDRHVRHEALQGAVAVKTSLHTTTSILKSLIITNFGGGDLHQWTATIQKWKDRLIPSLSNIALADRKGNIIYSYPVPIPVSGRSEHAEEIRTMRGQRELLTDYHSHEKLIGEHFSVILPVDDETVLIAAFSKALFANLFNEVIDSDLNITLQDGSGTEILGNSVFSLDGYVEGDNPHQLLPANEALPKMVRWRKAYWQSEVRIDEFNDWHIRATVSMVGAIDGLQKDYIRKMAITLVFIILSLMLLPLLIRSLLTPMQGLTRAARMYTESTDRRDVKWPSSRLLEINQLIENFKQLIDVINRNKAELTASKEQYRSLLDQLPLEVWEEDWSPIRDEILALQEQGIDLEVFARNHPERIKELENRIVVRSVNAGAFAINKATSRAQLDSVYDDNPEPAFTFMPSLKAFLSGKTSMVCEGIQKIATGDLRFQQSEVFMIRGTEQDWTRVVTVSTDITEFKQSQAQVIQASKLATLGEMATGVAHELNQPLTVIRMAASNARSKLVKGDIDADYLDQKLERIEGQTERAAAIIEHMRMFGRKAEGGDDRLDPRTAIDNALDLVGEQFRLARIEITTEFPDECPSVSGNMIQLEQVILNLLTNSRDAIEDKDGERKIWARVAVENDAIQIICEDTGGGFSQQALPRIFEPFYTTKEVGKGTGLGLSVSYGIIRDMGGTIEAENTDADAGAKFTITLPAA